MDYDMTRLGDKQFEHLAQALLVKYLGLNVQVFGAGPDGGREATWHGPVSDPRLPEGWNGYGVAQAKYMNNPREPRANAAWLTQQVRNEFHEWTKAGTRRQRKPQYYLIVTNTSLSAASGGGIDTLTRTLNEDARKCGLRFKGFAIWHYDQIRVLLDDSPEIRSTYAAWTTPGDVLASLMRDANEGAQDISAALRAHAAKVLVDERRLNLTQAGSVGDGPVGIADVFIDLPAYPPGRDDAETGLQKLEGLRRPALPGIVAEILAIGDRKFDEKTITSDAAAGRASRSVIIGGPGQGKSTVGQYLCQMYRAAFLEGSPITALPEVSSVRNAVLTHATKIGLQHPGARRWPIRIVLSDFADRLSGNTCTSVLDYITQQLAARSGSDVTLSQVRAWLRGYPWFVVFDGLDEVPEASNRAQVLTAISDFFIDARSVSADVVVVATSRPQGYNDDFGRDECRHYDLSPLPPSLALSYAKRLIAVRTGAGSDRGRQIEKRFEKASKEDTTSRLLTTPLQVTILTLLLERLGHAPRDRWRLFSQYYRVIYQREQEKGGALAELLDTHESDVHAIHYKIGLLLQQRGERSGDTRGALTKAEFSQIIAERLESQGNERAKAEGLANLLISLATDRLVFLAVLRDNEIGFEIRSLQEFMAAEALLARPDRVVVEGLRAIATASHWRNVFLFAAGRVFAVADKEHLRSEITNMCADLNLDTPLHEATLPGSRLALHILRERVTSTQPAFSRVLAGHACQILRLPPQVVRSLGLEDLASLDVKPQLMAALEDAASGSPSRQLSAIPVLSPLADSGDESARSRLVELIENSSAEFRAELLADVYTFASPSLAELLRDDISAEPPSRILEIASHYEREIEDSIKLGEPSSALPIHTSVLLRHGIEFADRFHGDAPLAELLEDRVSVRVPTLCREEAKNPNLPLRNIPQSEGPWSMMRLFAEFSLTPSAASLAQALEAAAENVSEAVAVAGLFPWPLAACIAEVDRRLGAASGNGSDSAAEGVKSEGSSDRLKDLALAARQGLLGDIGDWVSAEERWREESWSITDICRVATTESSGKTLQLPFDAQIAETGAVFSIASVGIAYPEAKGEHESLCSWLRSAYESCRSMPASQNKVALASALIFIFSVIHRREAQYPFAPSKRQGYGMIEEGGYDLGLDASQVFELLRLAPRAAAHLSDWFHRMSNLDLLRFEDEFSRMGGDSNLYLRIPENGDRVSADYFGLWARTKNWRLGRFRFHLSPALIAIVPELGSEDHPLARNLQVFAEAVILNNHGMDEMDDEWLRTRGEYLLKVWSRGGYPNVSRSATSIDSLDLNRLTAWLTHAVAAKRDYALASRLAIYLSRRRPTLAANLVKALYAIVESRPAGAIP
ncbi:hypothetical protein AB0C02_17940 [Micromonospora sp. NPDC048999]|uniref:NACHT domain-containing protein n=1 Tax=Micromonospora sp. NPDC048999 TaxID=3155391 RepID=UPI0033FA4FAF